MGSLSSLGDRMLLQRAEVAAATGNLVPLAHLAYSAVYVDPDTLEVEVDPGWSDAMFYAVECQDYAYLSNAGTPRQRLDAWLDATDEVGVDDLRLASVAYGDIPCLFWPAQPGDVLRPAPVVDAPYPTLVLTADTDTATPVANAMRVFSRAENSALVLQGGPHIIFDWGYACVDELVTSVLEIGEPPPARVTVCDGEIADDDVPVAPTDEDGYDDPLAAGAIVADQITASSEYAYWDAADVLTVGCDGGGSVEYTPTDVGTDVVLTGCEFTDAVAVTGTGAIDDVAGTVTLDLDLPAGGVRFESDGTVATVEGTYDGTPIDDGG